MTETDPLVGTTLGPCRLEALVGRGGMGRVYRARHLILDRVVAVKLVDGESSSGAVLAEARAAAKLEDPRVVAVYEAGEAAGKAYIVMQWVSGESLEGRVKRTGPLVPEEALAIMREVALALRAAHAAGVVHRDIKPGNILIDEHGAVKLADFGIALPAGVPVSSGSSASGSFHFMSPEQALGSPADPRSDLYSLGATWLYALSGQPPFPGSPMDALIRHRDEAAPDIRDRRPDVTALCSELILRLLAKSPDERPPDAALVLKMMAAPGMLLNTDDSGSPFRILPPPASSRDRDQPRPAAAPARRPAAVAAPPPVKAATLGSRTTFVVILAVLAAAFLVWPWRRAVVEDLLAAMSFMAAGPAFLSLGARREVWRKFLSPVLWLAAMGCFASFVSRGGQFSWAGIGVLSVGGLGAASVGGAAYLAPWGADKDEVLWARLLAACGAALMLVAALSWALPDEVSWGEGLSREGLRFWQAWAGTGGLWRWAGVSALLAALAGVRRLNIAPDKKAQGRNLNWNR